MNEYPGPSWFSRYRDLVNADRELGIIGQWLATTAKPAFTC
jgi:hypothetical protein